MPVTASRAQRRNRVTTMKSAVVAIPQMLPGFRIDDEVNEHISADLLPLAIEFQGFQADVQANPIAEFEAVCECFFRVVDAYRDTIDGMGCNAGGKSFATEPQWSHRRVLKPGWLGSLGKRRVDYVRDLRVISWNNKAEIRQITPAGTFVPMTTRSGLPSGGRPASR